MQSSLTPTRMPGQRIIARAPASRGVSEAQPRGRAVRDRRAHQRLAIYRDGDGRLRELVSRPGADDTVLVLDRDAASRGDEHLLAHLWADEPPENAALICSHYLRDSRMNGRRCRAISEKDLSCSSSSGEIEPHWASWEAPLERPLCVPSGDSFELRRVAGRTTIPQLRWCQRTADQMEGPLAPVSLRDVIARFESYEPLQTLTRHALALHAEDPELSMAVLRAELARVEESPIVLNRKLREVVLATVAREELSMSEIAIRCGRIKRDGRGNESGETSWLARRLGVLPEGGGSARTPWIHSQVLALIARSGLGVCPREVEA